MAKRIKGKVLILLLGAWVFFALAFPAGPAIASPSAQDLYSKSQKEYYRLMGDKSQMAYRDRWMACIKRFLDVYEKYPQSGESYKALFTVGSLYEKLYDISRKPDDREAALRYYQKTVVDFPPERLSDDALFRAGEILAAKKDYVAATEAFAKILRDHPSGDHAALAQQRLDEIRPRVKQVLAEKLNEKMESHSTLLKKVEWVDKGKSVQVISHLSGEVKFSQNRLSQPERIYINFLNSRVDPSLHDLEFQNRFVKAIRVSQFEEDTARLVLDLNPDAASKVVTWVDDSRVVVEILEKPQSKPKGEAGHAALAGVGKEPTKPVAIKAAEPAKPKAPVAVKSVPTALGALAKLEEKSPPSKPDPKASVADKTPAKVENPSPKPAPVVEQKKPLLIVVDPGHGGKDLGALGANGLVEKDLNLKISLLLKDVLEKQYHYRVMLTRGDDTFIPLKERGPVANNNEAALFVSIHANAAMRREAHGIETYYLGRALSEQARETAARENGDLVYSVADEPTQRILADMLSTSKMNDSARLAATVQEVLLRNARKGYKTVKDLGVKEGPFWVLHDTVMPSILVEVGFVTHRGEEKKLKDADYQQRLAESVGKGIYEFLKEKGPTI